MMDDNHNHDLQKRSPIDPNAIWQVPLFSKKGLTLIKKGQKTFAPLIVPNVPGADLKFALKGLKKVLKGGFFEILVPLSLIPI